MDAGRCAGIFAERPTEWIAVSNPSAGNQRFFNYVHMYMSALLCNIYAECMETVAYFKMNTVTENYWLIYAAAMVISPYHVGYYFQSLS